MAKNASLERKYMKVSVLASLMLALFALLMGWLLNSDFVTFDGLYSIISVFLSFLSLRAAIFVARDDPEHFPFGKEPIEVLIVLLQYGVVLVFLSIALSDAVRTIIYGGHEVEVGWVLGYLGISTVLIFLIYRFLKKGEQKAESVILTVEVNQWKISLIQSCGAFIGYLVAQILVWFAFDGLAPYIDPIMLVIIVIFSLRTPIKGIWQGIRELLGINLKKDPDIRKIKEIVESVGNSHNVLKTYLRVSKTGSMVFIEVDYVVPKNYQYGTVEEQDRIREIILNELTWITYEKWLTISFTIDHKWAE